MRIIQFKENEKEIWNKFIAENNPESFLQSWEWCEFQKSLGRKIWRIGIIEKNLFVENEKNKLQITNYKLQNTLSIDVKDSKLIAIALIVKHDLSLGRSYLYCPRGPVVKNKKAFDIALDEIKEIAKKEKSLFLKIDPPIDWKLKIENWKFKNIGFKKSSFEIQPIDTLMLDLKKTEEELLKEMKQKTRYNIRLAGKKELRITNYELRMDNKKVFEEKFEKFWKLIEETSARDKFKSHSKNYYWKMLESLCETRKAPYWSMEPTIKPMISYFNLQAKLYIAEYKNKIIVANIILYFGDMAIYLHGASSNEHRNLMAPYLLQWKQILDAKRAGYKKYDFWGIASKFKHTPSAYASTPLKRRIINSKFKIQNSKLNSWSGITRFKKGFGGYEKNYIGAYDLVFDNIGYEIYGFMRKMKRRFNLFKVSK